MDVDRDLGKHVDMEAFDLVILGAGPAGLAAGVAALEVGVSCIVVERGDLASRRRRDRPADLVSGVGGAGLYSDGKFSFAPSASALWRLEPASALEEAYLWAAGRLRRHGLNAPPFPDDGATDGLGIGPLKPYPSQYMALEERIEMIDSLEQELGDRLITGTNGSLTVLPTGVALDLGDAQVQSRAAVVASGRFGPLQAIRGVESGFRRVEIGMRVEQDAANFALDAEPYADLLDPKWIRTSPDGRYEWRTFCCCRRGEVAETRFGDITTVSGRADGAPSNRSNFGLNVRFMDTDAGMDALASALGAARCPPVKVQAEEFLEAPNVGPIADSLGSTVASALAAGLATLGEDLGTDLRGALLHLPAIEGVGYYPSVDGTLRVASSIWAAGDATGVFRGLVPALVSGRLAAVAASNSRGGG